MVIYQVCRVFIFFGVGTAFLGSTNCVGHLKNTQVEKGRTAPDPSILPGEQYREKPRTVN